MNKKHEYSRGASYIFWETKCKIPSTPSQLKKRDGVKWYLIYYSNLFFGVKTAECVLNSDCLLAEMISDTDFVCSDKCKIEIE